MVSFVNKIEDKPAVNALLGSLQFFKAPLLKKNEHLHLFFILLKTEV